VLLLLLLLLLSLSLVWRCTAVGAVTVLLVGCLYAAYVGGFTYYSLVVPHTCSLARLRVVVVALAYVALFHTSLCSLRSLGSRSLSPSHISPCNIYLCIRHIHSHTKARTTTPLLLLVRRPLAARSMPIPSQHIPRFHTHTQIQVRTYGPKRRRSEELYAAASVVDERSASICLWAPASWPAVRTLPSTEGATRLWIVQRARSIERSFCPLRECRARGAPWATIVRSEIRSDQISYGDRRVRARE